MVAGKLHHTPRYRQKVRFVPLGLSEPVWVDDRYFDLDYHLRHTAVPRPGTEAQLRAMAARVFSQHLDRARPLWEIWMVDWPLCSSSGAEPSSRRPAERADAVTPRTSGYIVAMARPVVLGVVGDSGAGKTTLTRGLIRVMGDEQVARINADDYHRYERVERQQLGITPLHPDANHLDVLTQHLGHLRRGEAVLKPLYDHRDGTLGRPVYVRSARYLVVEGLLNFHTETLRTAHDVRVFLAPPEDLRRAWKLKRDCTRRGYTTDEVLRELDRRERDAGQYIRPQKAHADMVVTFWPSPSHDPAHLDAEVLLCDTLPHPDLAPLLDETGHGPTLIQHERDLLLRIPGDIASEHAAELEEAVWARMSFANHLRVRRLGEFTIGTDLHRSHSLALVQVLVLYHLVWARASVNSGGEPARSERRASAGADSALHA